MAKVARMSFQRMPKTKLTRACMPGELKWGSRPTPVKEVSLNADI
jgi:hypothetical protein